jgi:hypothetical protein
VRDAAQTKGDVRQNESGERDGARCRQQFEPPARARATVATGERDEHQSCAQARGITPGGRPVRSPIGPVPGRCGYQPEEGPDPETAEQTTDGARGGALGDPMEAKRGGDEEKQAMRREESAAQAGPQGQKQRDAQTGADVKAGATLAERQQRLTRAPGVFRVLPAHEGECLPEQAVHRLLKQSVSDRIANCQLPIANLEHRTLNNSQ